MSKIPTNRPDEMLGEHYRIERELGHGGMATVYLCTDVRTGARVAVKILRPELGSVVTKERFSREITFTSELDHPRIPRVIDSGTAGLLPFYAMTFVEGESLRERLMKEPRLPIEEARRIAAAIAGPMGYAHERNIVHRDIKPENILLSGDKVYVLDFGVARAIAGAAGDRLTGTGITLGTPAYMSPEQVTAERDLDVRSDIYSLGCVVYEMLAGTPPFSASSPQLLMSARFSRMPRALGPLRGDVPEEMEKAIAKAMARAPEDRWQSVDAFVDALLPPAVVSESGGDPNMPRNELLEKLKKSFADLYVVESELKGGGMSRLFLATDVALKRKVVIKILPPDLISPMMLARFRRESEVTAGLQHPHILPVISAGVKDELVHYVMPFIDGESLRALLERTPEVPISYALRLFREMTDALAYAHKAGVIHRDIKPENVLIQDGHAVLADFGIAAALSGDGTGNGGARLTGTGMSLGTVGYMAPEQALGEKTVDARADIYAMGVVGFELFAGKPPFTGETDQAILIGHLTKEAPDLCEVRRDTPDAVADSIKRAMQKDPALRFQNAGEFRDAIDAAYNTTGSFATRSTDSIRALRVSRFKKLPTKWRVAVPIAAIAAIAAIATVVVKLRGPSTSKEGVMIVIAPFNVPTSSLGLWREGMVDLLSRYLDGIGPLRTVSPTASIKGFPVLADSASVIALAKRTNAKYAVWGNLSAGLQGQFSLRTHILDVSAEKVFDPDPVTDSTVERVAGKGATAVINYIGRKVTLGAVKQGSLGYSSIDALRAFLKGEQFFRTTAWDSAAVYYASAVAADSNFALALRRSAQVGGWQRNGSDSTARAQWLKAGAKNHGLAYRDSLLLTSDSLMAALAPLRSDSMDWTNLRRLFTTVDNAAAKYPDDPEVWYEVGEARFHHGYGTPADITERQTLDAFKKSIALDSAFAPAYVHAIELSFTLDSTAAGKKYAKEYLALNPTAAEAEGISIVDKITEPGANVSSVVDTASTDAIMAAYFTLRRWPDPGETALKLLQSSSRRPRSSPTFAADSSRVWNFLPLALAYRGHLAQAYKVMGDRPSRLFVELALLGGIPADSANAVIGTWIAKGLPQSFYALPWLAQRGDQAQLKLLMTRADSAARVGTEFSRRGARYRALSTRAYLSLATHDTDNAVKQFAALPDTLCIACYMDRLQAARLLFAKGNADAADNLLNQRLNNLITPTEILIAMERGRIAAKQGRNAEAIKAFRLVSEAWAPGDPAVKSYVDEAKREIAKAGG